MKVKLTKSITRTAMPHDPTLPTETDTPIKLDEQHVACLLMDIDCEIRQLKTRYRVIERAWAAMQAARDSKPAG